MDGAYHPIWAAFPSNPTLGSKAVARRPHRMGLAPAAGGPDRGNSELRETKTSGCLRPMRHTSRSRLLATGFGVGLLPVHSPLLRESRLVSFPPLSDMLKFSGSSRPSRGRRFCVCAYLDKRRRPRAHCDGSGKAGGGGRDWQSRRPRFVFRPPRAKRRCRRCLRTRARPWSSCNQ